MVFAAQLSSARVEKPVEHRKPSNTVKTTSQKPMANGGISIQPIWLVLSGIGAKFEYFATDIVSLGLDGIYIPEHQNELSSKEDSAKTTSTASNYRWAYNEINLGTNIMLTGNLSSSGAYINPAIGYVTSKITDYSEYRLQGSFASPQARLTAGYQWVNRNTPLRLAVGGGLRAIQSSEIVVRDAAGDEVLRQNSSTLGGAALDFHLGFLF